MNRRAPARTLILALIFALSSFAGAQEPVYRLTLDEATRLALLNNFDIQLTRYDTWIARTGEQRSLAVYDALLEAGIGYRNDQSDRSSTIFGTKSLENTYDVDVRKLLPTGTTLGAALSHNRTWSNSAFATANPAHDSTVELSIEQALGRNFFGIQNRGAVKLSRLEIDGAQYTSLEKIEEQVAAVQAAYWDVVRQNDGVAIRKEMAAKAEELWRHNQDQFAHGLVEAPDLIASEANYAELRNDLLIAEEARTSRLNVLRLLLNIPDDAAAVQVEPDTAVSGEDLSPDAALKNAFANRFDYRRLLTRAENRDLNLVLKKQNLWPEINLEASLARNGVANDPRTAVGSISAEDNPDTFVGLRLSYPFENSAARADRKAAELDKARALLDIKRLEREIAVGIVDQVRLCRVREEVARNAENIARLQTDKLEAEQVRFNQGRSDVDTLIRFQQDVSLARWQAAEARFHYQTALIDLRRQEGTLLKGYVNEAEVLEGN